jgi:hypothetical protein
MQGGQTPRKDGMEVDLKSLSLKELKDLQSAVAREIAGFQERQKKMAIEKLEEKARELGFSLAELTGMATVRKKSSPVAKYANLEPGQRLDPRLVHVKRPVDFHLDHMHPREGRP